MGPLSLTVDNYTELMSKQDTIIACATPSSTPMGLAILRISGGFKLNSFSSVIKKTGPMGPLSLAPRIATLVNLVDPLSPQTVIDNALATYFSGPNSFTGENTLEISLHGNPRLVDRVIELFQKYFGLRMASPGEFTLRAYRNKKLSLSQVEGLDLLLHATTQPLIELSQYMLNGSLQSEFIHLKNVFDKHSASIDVLTDFSEDIGEAEGLNVFNHSWDQAIVLVESFYMRSRLPLDFLLKPTVVLFGPPNAGKSTLFNLITGFKRAIVSETPGTTRDYIKESIFINNNEFFLIDTAGIRETNNSIEDEGIHFTFKNLESSFARILVYSAKNFDSEDFKKFLIHNPTLLIISHSTFLTKSTQEKIEKLFPGKIYFTELNTNQLNIDDVKSSLITNLMSYFENRPIIAQRQRLSIEKLFVQMKRYDQLIKSDLRTDMAIISSEFNALRELANNLIGIVDVDEILKYIFNNFCIGK